MNKKLTTSLVASLLIATSNLHAEELSQITVVSATKSEQSIKDVTSDVDVITKEEIEERHYTTVNEAINSLSGINVINNGGLGKQSSVFMRGFDGKRILVLIDGIKVNDVTSASGAQFENLMLTDIKRIEVIKGAQSGIWGADASAGVINIITKTPKDGTNGTMNVEYGSYNTKKYGLSLSHKTKDYYIKGSFSKLDSDGFTAKAPRGKDIDNYEDDGYKNLTSNIKVGYNFDDNNKIDLIHTIINARNEYDGSNDSKDDTHSITKDRFSSINYNHTNDIFSLDVHANKSKFHREYIATSPSKYDGSIKDYGVKTNVPYLNNTSFLIFGADYKDYENKNDLNRKYDNKAIFITNNNKFNNNMTIVTESLRYDKYSDFNNKSTGKIGIKQYINDDLYFKSNYGTAYNIPTLSQMYGKFGPNPLLNPESTKSFDIGLNYKGFDLTYFSSKVDDMIDWDGSGYKNLDGTSKLKGYELSYIHDLNSDILLTLNYTHLNVKDNKGYDLERRAKDSMKFGLDYYGIKKFHFNINGQYIGDRKQYKYGTHDVSARTGNYTLWNGVINYEIKKNINTYMKIDNIFNKYYQNIDGYATAERSAYVGLKVSF